MGDETILVPVGEGADQVNGVDKINKEGLEIEKKKKNSITKAEIVEILSAKYENDQQTLSKWVDRVVDALSVAGLIDNY